MIQTAELSIAVKIGRFNVQTPTLQSSPDTVGIIRKSSVQDCKASLKLRSTLLMRPEILSCYFTVKCILTAVFILIYMQT